jgi:flavin-dependent dehydrogenase
VLLDRAEFPRDKSCGDGVAPQVLDVLARLGVRGLLDDWPTIDRLELGYPGGPWLAGRTARPNRVVPRRVLDARLVDAAVARGATLLRRRVRSVTVPVTGDPSRAGDPVVAGVRARVVVGADGAHSAVRAALAPPGGRSTAIALRGYAPAAPGLAHAQVIAFDPEGSWPAYAWSFPIGDGSANVGYGEILDADGAAPTRAHLLARLQALLPGAADGAVDWKGHHLPLSTGRWHQPDGRVLLAGDALGLVNPLTGEGIHAAVLSGALAGLAAVAALRAGRPEDAGRRYRSALQARFGRHQRHMALLSHVTRAQSGGGRGGGSGGGVAGGRTPGGGGAEGRGRRLVGAALAAAQHDQRIFDDLAELGLAEGPLTPRIVLGLLTQLPRTA